MKLSYIIYIIAILIVVFVLVIHMGFLGGIKESEHFSTNAKVLYTPKNQEKDWEADFIQHDICKGIDVVFVPLDKVRDHVSANPSLRDNHIFVFSSNDISYDDLLKIVIDIKPTVIIHLSDEWGTYPKYTYLTSKTKLVLRQHNFRDYNIRYFNNMYHMPLGYMTGMLKGTSSVDRNDIPPMIDRKYTWSFVGNMKQDREEMLSKFKDAFSNYYNENTSPENMFNVYKNSVFVLNGRGNVSINCFRVYEAALAGAIPVIVGDWDAELKETFNLGSHDDIVSHSNIPPFIYENNWDAAVTRCKTLLNDPDALEEMQVKVLIWWNNIVKDMQTQIRETLNDTA